MIVYLWIMRLSLGANVLTWAKLSKWNVERRFNLINAVEWYSFGLINRDDAV